MLNNIGFRINVKFERPLKELIQQFRNYPTSNIADTINRFFCMNSLIQMINKKEGVKLVGSALTVKTRVADNLMVHKAIDIAQPGDVIVVDADGDMSHALVGEIMVKMAIKKRLSGYVINGCIRDREAIEKLSFPVFAKGSNPKGPYKDGPGEINFPISCGGVLINPGDIIVGDRDGIVIIPLREAQLILEKVKAVNKTEEEIFRSIEKGVLNRDWVDEKLNSKGCQFINS